MNNYPWNNTLPHDRRSMFIDERDGLPEFNYRFNALIDQKKNDAYNIWRIDPQALVSNRNIKPYMKLLGDAMFLSEKLNIFDEHTMMPGSLLNKNHITLLNVQIEALEAIVREKEVELILNQYADIVIVREREIKDLKKENESLKKDIQKIREKIASQKESGQTKLLEISRAEWESWHNCKIQNQDFQKKIQLLQGNVIKEVAKNTELLQVVAAEKQARQNLENKVRNERIPLGHGGIKLHVLELEKERNVKINLQVDPAKELLKQNNLDQEKKNLYLERENLYREKGNLKQEKENLIQAEENLRQEKVALRQETKSLRQERENLKRALSEEKLATAALKKNIEKEYEAKEAIKKELSKERIKNEVLEKEVRNQRTKKEIAQRNESSLTSRLIGSKIAIIQPTGPSSKTYLAGMNSMSTVRTTTALPKYSTNYMSKYNFSTAASTLTAKTPTSKSTFKVANTGRGWMTTSKSTSLLGTKTQSIRRSLSNPNLTRRNKFNYM